VFAFLVRGCEDYQPFVGFEREVWPSGVDLTAGGYGRDDHIGWHLLSAMRRPSGGESGVILSSSIS
jgi:hypothetical protein